MARMSSVSSPVTRRYKKSMQQIALGCHVDVRFHNVNTNVPHDYDWQAVGEPPELSLSPAAALPLSTRKMRRLRPKC